MRVLMYAPGGGSQGVGHTMRALALAEEASTRGWSVVLAGELIGPALAQARQVPGVRFAGAVRPAELVELASEARVVHLDAYDKGMEDLGFGGVVVSSMADGSFGIRPADVVIDTSPGAPARHAHIQRMSSALCLLGPRYAPIRQRVRVLRGSWDPPEGRTRVLVVMGGTDPRELTLPVVAQLAGLPNLDLTVVAHPDEHRALRNVWGPSPGVLRTVRFLDDLIREACQHTMVVSAAGTSVWEFACAGVPMALVCAVENQLENYGTVVTAGAAIGLTDTSGDLVDVAGAMSSVLESASALAALSERASGLADGQGAWRVVSAWESLVDVPVATRSMGGMVVRNADSADAEMLWRWRNDETTRRFSRESAPIPRSAHMDWVKRTLQDQGRHLLVVEKAGQAVGAVRWDQSPGTAWESSWEISITLSPTVRGRGMALEALRTAEDWLAHKEHGALRLIAVVHETNAASARLFRRAGYVQDDQPDDDGFLPMSRSETGFA